MSIFSLSLLQTNYGCSLIVPYELEPGDRMHLLVPTGARAGDYRLFVDEQIHARITPIGEQKSYLILLSSDHYSLSLKAAS